MLQAKSPEEVLDSTDSRLLPEEARLIRLLNDELVLHSRNLSQSKPIVVHQPIAIDFILESAINHFRSVGWKVESKLQAHRGLVLVFDVEKHHIAEVVKKADPTEPHLPAFDW